MWINLLSCRICAWVDTITDRIMDNEWFDIVLNCQFYFNSWQVENSHSKQMLQTASSQIMITYIFIWSGILSDDFDRCKNKHIEKEPLNESIDASTTKSMEQLIPINNNTNSSSPSFAPSTWSSLTTIQFIQGMILLNP